MQFNKLYILSSIALFLGCNSAPSNLNVVGSLSYTEIPADSIILDQLKGEFYYNKTLFTGTSVENYANGNSAINTQYVDGKREGTYTKWFEDGTKSFEVNYSKGKQNGYRASWWRNGNLRSVSHLVNGIPEGLQYQW